MKKTLLFTLSFFILTNAFSQENFKRFSIGVGGGITQSFSDVKQHGFGKSFNVNADYYFTPFITAGIEGQFGKIVGGNKVTDPHLRAFENSYSSILINGKVQLGQFIDYRYDPLLTAIKGIYVGLGLGMLNNNMSNIVRIKPDGSNYTFPGADKSKNLMLPLSTGINFGINDYFGRQMLVISVGYSANITFGEGMDGYNDPSIIFANKRPDIYTYATAGVKICFGPQGLFY